MFASDKISVQVSYLSKGLRCDVEELAFSQLTDVLSDAPNYD
jgi:hypothetical protein